MKNKVFSIPQTAELLQFIVPRPLVSTAICFDAAHEIIQRYEYRDDLPDTIVMCETNKPNSDFRYVFKIKSRELIVESCTETTASGQLIESPVAYTYFRMPESTDKPAEWEYSLSDNLRVCCTARFCTEEIDSESCTVIHLTRIFTEVGKSKNAFVRIERYAKGYGIRHINEFSCLTK